MKRICLYIFALIAFMQIGCVRDEEFTGTASDDGSGTIAAVAALPVDEALSDLRQQLDAMRNSTRSAAFDAETVAVLRRSDFGTTRAAAKEVADSLAYIVNFADGGYAILGADPHLPSVIAIVEKGEMTPETLVAAKRSTDSGERIDTPTYIDALVTDYILRTSDDPTPVARISGDWVVKEHQPSFVKTKWRQGSTKFDTDSLYNKYCINDAGQLCKAGCVAIATVQMLLHNHKTYGRGPRSITGIPLDWAKLDAAAGYVDLADAPAEIQDYAARFIHEVGLAVAMNYGISESTANNKKVLALMKSSLMNRIYTNAQLLEVPGTHPWNPDVHTGPKPEEMPMSEFTDTYVRPLLYSKKQPLYISGDQSYDGNGSGHAWILDGWQRKTRSAVPAGESFIADYVYCNYGWDGSSDGIYHIGVFYKYNCFIDLITYRLF